MRIVGDRVREALRDADVVSRLGGDEFVLVIPTANSLGHIDNIAQKLVELVASEFMVDDYRIFISASVGIANYPRDARTAEDLLKFSDQSMYLSKHEGKNRFAYFTPVLERAAKQRVEISSDLRSAIHNQHFQLHYHPIVDLKSNEITKAEALIRWVHPDKGIINPGSFIPIAEETGIICDIGLWVFESAFQQMRKWRDELNFFICLSVNMSPYQFKSADNRYEVWVDWLDKYKIEGDSIVIEITEGLLLEDDRDVDKKLLKYRDMGIRVVIDDFGTGYSSLAYLKKFDIDYLKIDQSFVRNLSPGSSDESLCEAIIVMAHKLGLKVIAEGIETLDQLTLLQGSVQNSVSFL